MDTNIVTINKVLAALSNESLFLVEVGRNSKGSYKTRYSFQGHADLAVLRYSCTPIGPGYKKRLAMVGKDGKKTVLVREFA